MQRKLMIVGIEPQLQGLALQCAPYWFQISKLEAILLKSLANLQHGQLLYAIDKTAKQITGNVTRHGVDVAARQDNLSTCTYSASLYPKTYFSVSRPYQKNTENWITALQPVLIQEEFIGFIALDLISSELSIMTPMDHKKISP